MTKSIQEIADHIQAEVIGNDHFQLNDISEITFLPHLPKDMTSLEKIKALAIIISEKVNAPKTKVLLITKNPKLSFAKALELFERPADIKPGIDPRSWVEESAEIDGSAAVYPFVTIRRGAKIGKNVILYPGVYIGQESVIDENSILYPHVVILPKTIIGKRVLIHSGTVIGEDGFGYVWDGMRHYKVPQLGKVIIEDDVEIGANSAIDRATTGETRVKKGSKIDNLVQIGHNVQIGNHCILCGQVGIGGSSSIGDGSILGGQVGVGDHIQVGHMSKAAGQTGIVSNTLPKATLIGFPAMPPKDFLRIIRSGKKLSEMQKTIQKLQKEVESLKQKTEK